MLPRSSDRLHWLDTAKGVSILLVVFWHVLLLSSHADFEVEAIYRTINEPLLWIRMPMFFVVSGYVMAHSAGDTWHEYFFRRLLPLIWVYAVWTSIYTLVQSRDTSYLLTAWWNPELHLWFIWALLGYRAIGKALSPWPGVALGLAAAVSVALTLPIEFPEWLTTTQQRFLRNALFFLVAFWYGHIFMRKIGESPIMAAIISSVVVFFCDLAGFTFGLSLGGLVAGLSISALLDRYINPISRIFKFLGRHSLEIFLIHFAAVATITANVAGVAILHALVVPVSTVISALLPVLIRKCTDHIAPWLFVLPRFDIFLPRRFMRRERT